MQPLVVARKASELLIVSTRPTMLPIDPDTLVLQDEEVAGSAEFPAVLREVAASLQTSSSHPSSVRRMMST